jgi:hypothetical protein
VSFDFGPQGSAKNESKDSKEKIENMVDERNEAAKVSLPLKQRTRKRASGSANTATASVSKRSIDRSEARLE